MEVIEEAADGPVEFRPQTDPAGFSVWAGEVLVAAVATRPDRLGFAATGEPSALPCWSSRILSPGDETYDKLDWYAAGGVDEVLVVDAHSRQAEVFGRLGSRMVLVESAPGRLESLGVELETVEGPKLRLTWDGGTAEV